jgi:choline dehydrogenase-like flavoprotein
MNLLKTQTAVVGTGAGGPMVAEKLAMAGNDVVLIERGPYMAAFANKDDMELGRDLYQDGGRYPRTEEGYSLLRGSNVGGTTELAIGHGVRAFEEEFKSLGIDLDEAFRETEKDLGVAPMPQEHIGPNAALLAEAAGSMDMEISTWTKCIDFDRCTHCGRCVITCPTGAKWSSNRVIEKLRGMENVRLLSQTTVRNVRITGGRATGVRCETATGPLEIRADRIILCAGGLGSPVILQNSGVDAGHALFLDVFPIVYGRSPRFRAAPEPSMSVLFNEHRGCGYVLAPHVDVALMFQGIKGWFGDSPPYGIMVKVRDDNRGRVDAQGRVFKHLTEADQRRVSQGVNEAVGILQGIGIDPETITVSGLVGGHPGGTAAVGDVVDPDLACKSVKNLYVCDASVFPRSPGKPPIVTICALAKRLGESLIQ